MTVEERWAEQEAAAAQARLRKARRQRPLLLAVMGALVLATGVTAAVDLRRLQTPGGTALKWTQAAVFGDCDDYLRYSVGDGSVTDERTDDQLCRDLRAATKQARADSITIGLALGPVREDGSGADVQVTLTRSKRPVVVAMRLVKRDGRWVVVRDARTCASVGCA